ncbi:MAG: hypothetical protein IJR90_02550, partial [Clostridia bacterium]|nr:hypothetical protein [Clostridia bacterium]
MYEFKTNAEPFGRAYLNCESKDRAVRTAAGIAALCRESKIKIDLAKGLCFIRADLVNAFSQESVTGFSYRNPNYCWPWRCECEDGYSEEEKEDLALIRREMEPWTRATLVVDNFYSPVQKRMMESDLLWGGNWIGHANPDFADPAIYGTDALRAKVEKGRAA